ncbi:MAG TPA: NUDIX hydrolase [Candidatus Binatia bacterium]|nr:NUDIX hydrolase [Candidatus Binatia bacterium]
MSEIANPIKASTIVVVRPDTNGGIEVLMTRRRPEMQFLGGFLVFPGGGVENEDCSEKMLSLCRGLTRSDAQKILGADIGPEMSLGHWVAAIRELFEETGIHFFIDERGLAPDVSQGDVAARLSEKRRALSNGTSRLPQLLESERLFCDLGRLTYLFHRITPEKYAVRFDTRFYLAALPPHQTPLTSSEEVSESLWIEPKIALDESASGKFPMMPPTIITLRTLAEHGSWQNLCAAFRLR